MAYPEDLESKYNLRDYNFAVNDNDKLPYDENQFKKGYRNADESATDSVPDAHNVNWIYDILYANLRYTKDTAIENKNLLANKKATSTTLGQIKVGQGLKVLSDGTLMLETPIIGDKQSVTYDIPVGMFMLWSGTTVPDLFIEPDGNSRSKSEYSELISYANTNSLYGSGKLLYDDPNNNNNFIIKDMRGDFIKIASDNSGICVHENASLPTLTIENSTHSHSVTSGNGTAHRHSMGSLSYNSSGSLKFVIMNENGNFTASGNISLTNNSVDTGSTYGFEGDSKCRKAQVNVKTANGSWSGSMDTESAHTHTITITDSGSHNHTITHSAGTNNNGKVIPANWGFKLILKAKTSQPVRTVPIGTILDYTGNPLELPPSGFLYAFGTTVPIDGPDGYRDLYDWAIENGLMKEYSEYQEGKPHSCYYKANNNTEFIIPNLVGVYRRGESSDIGVYEDDGAPNIQGTFLSNSTGLPELSGAFTYTSSSITSGFVTTTSTSPVKVEFNASDSNTTYINGNPYGRKDYIQPKTVRTLPILKY